MDGITEVGSGFGFGVLALRGFLGLGAKEASDGVPSGLGGAGVISSAFRFRNFFSSASATTGDTPPPVVGCAWPGVTVAVSASGSGCLSLGEFVLSVTC